VYDVFFFVNEIDVLDIRLHELASAVDYFVIIQCPISFQNRVIQLNDPFQLEVLGDVRGKMRVFTCNLAEYPTEVRSVRIDLALVRCLSLKTPSPS
jgi:hypothetical protein